MSSALLNGIFSFCIIILALSLSVCYFIDNFTTRESAQYIRFISSILGGISVVSITGLYFYKQRKSVSATTTHDYTDIGAYNDEDLTTTYM